MQHYIGTLLLAIAGFTVTSSTSSSAVQPKLTDASPPIEQFQQATETSNRSERFQSALDRIREEAGFPGATAAYILPDGTLRSFATGDADREKNAPMREDARMLSGSTGKSFVAAIALSLAQDDVLDLDAPISTWLGDRPWFEGLPNAEDITLRMLLRHQSGLPDHFDTEAFTDAAAQRMRSQGADFSFTPEELVGFVLDQEPLFPAGKGYSYSDTGYILAGLIIEEVTDSDYYDVLRRRFLNPLNLEFTEPADQRNLPGLVPGYIEGEAPFDFLRFLPPKVMQDGVLVFNPAIEWTGGGLVTNPQDLVRWAKALYEGKAMEGNYLDDLLAAVPKDESQQERFGSNVRYGLGVTIRQTKLGTAYGHRGWNPGYLSIFEYYPDYQVAMSLQINELGEHDTAAYAETLARIVVDEATQTTEED